MAETIAPLKLDYLNDIMRILGTTKGSFWPFVEGRGVNVMGLSAEAVEDDFSPIPFPGGVFGYMFQPTGDHHLAGSDHADYSHGNGTVDSAFSVGAYILPRTVTAGAIIAKYDSAGNTEEYRFHIDSNGKLSLELHDASASASEIGVSDTALTLYRGVFAVATYDGAQATPEVKIYVDGEDDLATGLTTESGSYVAMEATAAPLTIGCSGVTATPVDEFDGMIALPFMTGKALTVEEVGQLHNIYKVLLGLA